MRLPASVRIKSRTKIEATLDDGPHHHVTGLYFMEMMYAFCGLVILIREGAECFEGGYQSMEGGGCYWHPDWFDIIDDDQDAAIIEELTDMLTFILEARS